MLHCLIPTQGNSAWGCTGVYLPLLEQPETYTGSKAAHGTAWHKALMPSTGENPERGYPEKLWRHHLGMILGNILQLTLL